MKNVDELLALVENGLKQLNLSGGTPVQLYEPMDYILQLKAKRIRPALVLQAYQAFSNQPAENCLNAALAIELFHNFSLIHDDIMDNAPTRRGMPSVHAKWGSSVAILAGDALFAYTMQLVARDFPDRAAMLINVYSQVALEVCEGQMLDMLYSESSDVTIPQYVEMIRQKTAALIGGSLEIGALAAGAPPETAKALNRFGQLMGVSFQLQDDYLDLYANATSGKQLGGDILENKKTYLWIRSYEKANADQRAELTSWLAVNDRPDEKIAAVSAVFSATNVAEDSRQLALDYYAQAEACLAQFEGNAGVRAIYDYFQTLLNRQV